MVETIPSAFEGAKDSPAKETLDEGSVHNSGNDVDDVPLGYSPSSRPTEKESIGNAHNKFDKYYHQSLGCLCVLVGHGHQHLELLCKSAPPLRREES